MIMPTWTTLLFVVTAVGCVQRSIRRTLLAPFMAAAWLAEQCHRWATGALVRLAKAASDRLRELHLDDNWRASYLVGTALSTTACAIFLAAEGAAIIWSMEALGLGAAYLPPALQRADVVLTASLLAAGVYALWAAHALDDDAPSLLVISDWLSPGTRRGLRRLALVSFGLVATSVIGLGVLRARELVLAEAVEGQVTDVVQIPPSDGSIDAVPKAPLEPDAIVTTVRYVVSTAGAASLMGVSTVAWQLGPAQAAPLLSLVATWVAMVLVGIVRSAFGSVWAVLRATRALVTHVLDALLAIATIFTRPLATLLRTVNVWAEDRSQTPQPVRLLKATLAALTAVAWDIQIPRPGAWVEEVDPIRVADSRPRRAA